MYIYLKTPLFNLINVVFLVTAIRVTRLINKAHNIHVIRLDHASTSFQEYEH
jgi:hypothetical protein